MGRVVIVGYRPKPGQAGALRALMQTHVPRLREAGLVTDRAPITMEAKDGTILEVFEWMSKEAIASAHSHPVVQQMWHEYDAVCDYVPAGTVAEMERLFSEFTPLPPP